MREMLLATLAAGVVATPAFAAGDVTVSLKGQVYYLTSDMNGPFYAGETATAWFKYNSASPGQAWYPSGVLDPTVRYYPGAPIAGGMQIGSYKVTFDGNARMFVTNDEPSTYGPIDRLLFDDFGAKGAAVNGRPLDVVSISWQDNSAKAFNSLALPTSAGGFKGFVGPLASLDWNPYTNAAHRISIDFTTVSVVPGVPEPATWAMMLLGFGMVGFGQRRRAKPSVRVTHA